MHYVLRYQYVPDILERRDPYRADHLRALWAEADAGRLIVGGGTGDPTSEGLMIFDVDGPADIEAYVARDPYIQAGLVEFYEIVPYTTVVGALAQNPVRPD